ncbi:MAG: FtsX-like permease family protein [Geminicoccaceae bacterium]
MSLLGLSLAYLRSRLLGTCLNLLLLALGVGMIVLLLLFTAKLEERLTRDATGLDLVIGAKGSPLQLILSSIYHLDIPTGNIPVAEVERWRRHDLVSSVIPLALGDSLGGFRIVGTETAYAEHYAATLSEGRFWEAPSEAVLGSDVAAKTGLLVGDRFLGNHGLAPGGPVHGDHPYEVVGLLSPTTSVLDRLVLTGVDSVWASHGIEAIDEEHDTDEEAAHDDGQHVKQPEAATEPKSTDRRQAAVTALLVRYRSPLAAVQLPPLVNQTAGLQAAAPALEMARLVSMIGIGTDAISGFGLLLIAMAGLSVFIGLTHALQARRYDLAVMRTMGASPRTLFALLLLEGALLAGGGVVLGLLLGHGAASMLAANFPGAGNLGLSGWTWIFEEIYVVGFALAIGLIAALFPAIQAYRTDIAATLASGR